MNDDESQLLRDYTKDDSEAAFRALVDSHIGLVYATARRVAAGDSHLAQDVTQLVFTDLARKARSLPAGVVLAGWLHRHTCFTAAKLVRGEIRRRNRERIAMEMNALAESSAYGARWRQLSPLIDEALNSLAVPDRDAIALRFFERRDLRSIGRVLGISEDAAQKRIARALEKLRGYLTHRGLTLSTALLATTLDAGEVCASVPAGLAATVSVTALKTASQFSPLFLLKTMITSKYALGIASLTVLTGAATVLIGQNKTAEAGLPAPAPQAPALATVETKTPAQTVPAPTTQTEHQRAILGSRPVGQPAGAFSSSSHVQVKKGTVIVATTKDGVTKTEPHQIPPDGMVISPATETGGVSFSVDTSPAAAVGSHAITTVTKPDGTVETKRTDFVPDADGKVHAGGGVSMVSPESGSGPALTLHDHEPIEKKAEPAPTSK